MLFGREADKLEHANDDLATYYLIEREPIVNKYISVPKDKGELNCAVFIAGIVEAVMVSCGFPAKVSAHYHQGTTYIIKLDDSVLAREKMFEDK